jgi:hypothetical protein
MNLALHPPILHTYAAGRKLPPAALIAANRRSGASPNPIPAAKTLLR